MLPPLWICRLMCTHYKVKFCEAWLCADAGMLQLEEPNDGSISACQACGGLSRHSDATSSVLTARQGCEGRVTRVAT
jgi:hypothetical protein